MKRLLLILLCLLASPALADDTITSWTWSSVTGTFQAKLAALGWKNVPDLVELRGVTATPTVNTGSCSGCSVTYDIVKVGHMVTFSGTLNDGTVTGSPLQYMFTLPNGWTTSRPCHVYSDNNTNALLLTDMNANSGVVNMLLYVASTQANTAFSSSSAYTFTDVCIIN